MSDNDAVDDVDEEVEVGEHKRVLHPLEHVGHQLEVRCFYIKFFVHRICFKSCSKLERTELFNLLFMLVTKIIRGTRKSEYVYQAELKPISSL